MLFTKRIIIIVGIVITLISAKVFSQQLAAFKSPDASNQPITYWMFINGNITKEGITKDLEAMKAAGINGTFFFSIGSFAPGPVKFMSEPWWDAVAHAMKESDRLKMKFGIYNSDGWSMSGGPWITPEESMKVLVWSDTIVQGGKTIHTKLPQTEFKSIYEDISIMAFPALTNDEPLTVSKIVASTLVTNPEAALDNDRETNIQFLKAQQDKVANIVVDFGRQRDIRRVVLDNIKSNAFLESFAHLEYSDDGIKFTAVKDSCPLNLKAEGSINQLTFTFSKINARYVRLSIRFDVSTKKPVPISQNNIDFGEVLFYESPRMNLWEPKSGESKRIRHERQQIFIKELNSPTSDLLPDNFAVSTRNMIDLSDKVDKDGNLNWDAPLGNWIIQRVGYTSTNRKVGPATIEGRGLECNKMDAKAVEKHFNAYSGKMIDLSEKLLGRPIDYMQMESWEAGIQNWTKGFEKEFSERNGYSIIPYLPVLAGGYVVDDYDTSNKFLWDFRNTVAQLIAENYWQTMYKCAKARGVTVSGEGSGMQHYLYDPMRYQQYLDIPMGEFWPNEGHARADNKNASSVAHTYGRQLVGSESFTSGAEKLWSITPYDLKQIGDEAFTLGVNQYVLHTYVHQPYDVAPGFTLMKFGNHLQRLNPWYTQAQGWFNYITRCQYMLRQGRNIQDIAYFSGEGIPSYLGLPWELHPALPEGFDYDGVNLDIIRQMTVKNGKLCLPTGACYHLLVFQDVTQMTPELVNEIKRLVAAGASIVSAKPLGSPSLQHNATANETVRALAGEVWGDIDGKKIREHAYGKGKVYCGVTPAEVLKKMAVIPDFIYTTAAADGAKINFVHLQNSVADTYFLTNYEKNEVKVKGVFRVGNKVPELWDPDKGTSNALPYRMLNDNQIEVPLNFDPLGSVFVVFKEPAKVRMQPEIAMKELKTVPLDCAWNVCFRSRTDTLKTVFEQLTDWSVNENENIRYFSGSAVYSQDIQLTKKKNVRVILNLGNVNNNMATVLLNGQVIAHLWKPPYMADISSFVQKGKNHLEIIVTNTATNSLIGDERFPSDLIYDKKSQTSEFPAWLADPKQRNSERKTFVIYKYLDKDSTLDPSGLVGPVSITYFTVPVK